MIQLYLPERRLDPPEPENGWKDHGEDDALERSRIIYEDRKESERGEHPRGDDEPEPGRDSLDPDEDE